MIFFGFMGGIFISVNESMRSTLIPSMTIFSVSMGALLGSPTSVSDFFGSNVKQSYLASNIPLWTIVISNAISAFIHLMLMSTILFFAAPIAFNADIPRNIPLYFLTLSIFILTNLSIASLIGLLVKGSSKLILISQIIFLPSIMLSGIMFPIEMLPDSLQNIGKIFPATWGFIAMNSSDFRMRNFLPFFAIGIVSTLLCIAKYYKIKMNK